MPERSYRPFLPAARPGQRPPGNQRPPYRVLVHRQYEASWEEVPSRVGLESAQQFYDHVAWNPGQPSDVNRTTVLKGKAGRALHGFSAVIHYEISGAARINFKYHNAYVGRDGDPHPIVQILTIDFSSH
jgi:hypothetical protein